MEKEIACKKCKVKFMTKVIYKDSRIYSYKDQRNFHCILRLNKVQYRKCQLCRNIKKACDMINKEMFS
jgi:hypothetical protein